MSTVSIIGVDPCKSGSSSSWRIVRWERRLSQEIIPLAVCEASCRTTTLPHCNGGLCDGPLLGTRGARIWP